MTDADRSCLEARDLADAHLKTVRAKLVELKALERSIAAFVETCNSSCAGGPGPNCSILEDLADAPAAYTVTPRRTERRA